MSPRSDLRVDRARGNVDIAWACGEGGTILHTTNGGATWTLQESGTTEDLHDMVAIEMEGGPVVAVSAGGTILWSTNQGATRTPRESGRTATLRVFSDFHLIAAGDDGVIVSSTDGGVTWHQRPTGTTARLHAVTAGFQRYVAGDGGLILRTTNNGLTWFPTSTGVPEDLYGTPMFGTANLAVGDAGLILMSSDNGQTWSSRQSGTTAPLEGVEYSQNNFDKAYVAGANGTILKTTDTGNSWGFQVSGTTADLHGLFFYLDDSRGWAAGDHGTILRTSDGGGPIVPVSIHHALGRASDLPALSSYPNPFRSSTTLDLRLPETGPAHVEIIDPSGRLASWHLSGHAREIRLPVWMDRGAAGVYLCRLSSANGTVTRKFVRAE